MFYYIAANWLQIFLSTGLACYAFNFVWTTRRWEMKYQTQRHRDAVKYQQQRYEDAGVDQKMARRRSKSYAVTDPPSQALDEASPEEQAIVRTAGPKLGNALTAYPQFAALNDEER